MEITSIIDIDPASRVLEAAPVVTSKTTKIDEAVEQYLTYRARKRFSPATMLADERLLRKFAVDMRSIQIRHLTPDHVSGWFYGPGGLMGTHYGLHYGVIKSLPGISSATANQYRSRLKVFFSWMTKRAMTKVDLLEDVDILPVATKVRQQPKPGILLAFLDSAVHPRDRAYLAVAMNSALRSSEVIRIRVGDVDLERGFFRVTTSKRSQADRMPITEDLDRELRRWFAAYEQDLPEGRQLQDSDFLFPGISAPLFDHYETQVGSGRVLLRTERQVIPEVAMGIQRSVDIVHRALKAAGLPTRYEGTHTIRRAVARAYFDSLRSSVGRDNALREVSALLHHSNSSMTERYLGLSAERDARDDAMRGKPFLSAMVTDDDDPPSSRA
jgi:integrase